MENPCTVVFLGDSILRESVMKIEQRIRSSYPDITMRFVDFCTNGHTSRDGLQKLGEVKAHGPTIVMICYGMNDWRKNVPPADLKRNLARMIDELETIGSRVVVQTITPSYDSLKRRYSPEVDALNREIRSLAYAKRIKIADASDLWQRTIRPAKKGLRDNLHPNELGREVICEAAWHVLTRRNTTLLWQYNGREAKCNYRCPYCYYIGLHNPSDASFGTIDQWHESFKESFGNQHLVFYLAFGEPTIGAFFMDIVRMIGSEPNWEMRMTTNLSQPLDGILKEQIVREDRLNINASFHPTQTTRDDFLTQIKKVQAHGIFPAIVYVAYPPLLKRLEDDISFFSSHGFVVHVRRFQGWYRKKAYPYSYTDEERRLVARYSDDASIKYMLNQQYNLGKMTYSGLHFFVVDNVGNVGYDSNVFQPYTKYRCIFGNIHTGNFRPLLSPGEYPGEFEGTVDGVANLLDCGYRELEGNNVLSFSRQGGVRVDESGRAVYGNSRTDFLDSRTRAFYNFPPRNASDCIYLGSRAIPYVAGEVYARLKKNATLKAAARKMIRKKHVRSLLGRFD